MVNASNCCSSIWFLTPFVKNRLCFGMRMVWSSNRHSKNIHRSSLMSVLVQACHVLQPLHLTRPSGSGMLIMSVKISTIYNYFATQSCPWKFLSILSGLFCSLSIRFAHLWDIPPLSCPWISTQLKMISFALAMEMAKYGIGVLITVAAREFSRYSKFTITTIMGK